MSCTRSGYVRCAQTVREAVCIHERCDECGVVWIGDGPPPAERLEDCGHAMMREIWDELAADGDKPIDEVYPWMTR